jgi:hypothetical protein
MGDGYHLVLGVSGAPCEPGGSLTPDLTPEERRLLANIPETELAELAAELSIAVPGRIDSTSLAARCIVALAQLARTEGLPFSRYDRADLEALSSIELRALAELCGYPSSVDGMLKSGGKVYKSWSRTRPRSPIALLLPTFLTPLARYAAAQARSE